tara:strand:+ start:88 stop:1779 length:1692 start_codon:yes stop_codon:yes gene_type:complete
MFEILISLITCLIIVLCSGIIASNLILNIKKEQIELFEVGLIGIVFLSFLSFLIHFFLPLNTLNNSILAIVIIFVAILSNLKFYYLKLKKEYIFIIPSLIIILIMTIKYKPNEDYGYYHLPYIINLISEKVIFGLSHLHANFAWNSSWLNFSSLFYFPFLEIKGTQLSNSILYFFLIFFFLKEAFKKEVQNNISQNFIFCLSFYIIIKFSRISEHGFDFPANIFLLLAFYFFLKVLESKDEFLLKKNFICVMLFSTFSITVKLSTFIAPLLVFSSFLIIIKKKINLKFLLNPLIFCFIFFIFWISQQFIYSGCFVPFFDFTCIKTAEWYYPNISETVSSSTGVVNKSIKQYTGILTPEEYVKNFNWVPTWFNRNKIELLEHFAAYLIPIIFIIIINYKSFFEKKTNELENNNKIFIITTLTFILLGLYFWFTKSPVIRFGIPYLFVFVFFVTIGLLNFLSKGSFNFFKGVKFVLILALIFNISKNINRIIDKKNDVSYWPKLMYFKYSSTNVDDFVINYPDSKDKFHQSKYCWSIPFICHIGGGANLKLEKKFNYIFIGRKND